MNTTFTLARRAAVCAALFIPLIPTCPAKDAVNDPTPASLSDKETPVQIAILLDTSSSMSGLIEQAKTQLWKIVNEFDGARQGGKIPVVQVALYEYGNSGLSVGTNWIRKILPLTRDLDKVSDELFKLTTNGGEEYCGAVIRDALDNLEWDKRSTTYKAIFIAGNEPFTQGPIQSDETCRSAIAKGIVVNAIHCGSESEGINGGWRRGAHIAEGKFLTINQDDTVVHIKAPQDDEIARLGMEINKTYIGYGKAAPASAANQVAQDGNAAKYKTAGAEVQRALTKSSSNYCNVGWDLVDACNAGKVALDAVPEAELPEEMKKLNLEERKAYVAAKAAERTKIQSEIKRLNEARLKFIAEQRKASGESKTLDSAMCQVVREQAAARANISFK